VWDGFWLFTDTAPTSPPPDWDCDISFNVEVLESGPAATMVG
jgi:hypothetical protein